MREAWRGTPTPKPAENLTELPEKLTEEEVCRAILNAGAVEIRDVDAGEEPFLYSSGNWGPGYVSIKGLVGQERVFKTLTEQLALRLLDLQTEFDFIAANATGGMIPGYQLREDLQRMTGRSIPYVYTRGTRKLGGHKELVTGIDGNPSIQIGQKPLIIEELINFAQSTSNSAIGLRELGFPAENAATVLHYHNPKALERLRETGITVVELTSLPKLIDVAEEYGYSSSRAIESYRDFLQNPLHWQAERGLKPKKI